MTRQSKQLTRTDLQAAGIGAIFLAASLFINYATNLYAFHHMSSAVSDALLDILPVVNVNFLFSEGPYLFVLLLVWALLDYPKRTAFLLKTLALFVVTRAFFICLTHLGPPTSHAVVDGTFPRFLSAGADFFFSGHTGVPFLMALIFWDDPRWRWIFLVVSIIAAVTVLLGHLHYSIDVFTAYFITHGVFLLAKHFFASDYARGMARV